MPALALSPSSAVSRTLMSLLKIPFLLLTAYYVDVSCARQPSAPPTQKERVVPTSRIERVLVRSVPALVLVIRLYAWTPVIMETVSIVAHNLVPRGLQLKLPRLLSASGSTFRITSTFAVGVAIAVLGARFRLSAYRALGKHFKFQLSTQSDHKLATTGPYGVVRHPSYTGCFAVFLGMDLAYVTPGSWLRNVVWPWLTRDASMFARVAVGGAALAVCAQQMLAVIGCSRRMAEEDEMMRTRFGTEWEEWAARVPYKLVPGVY